MILQTSGVSQLSWKNLIALDYPDIETEGSKMTCEFGNFGVARKEIVEATGSQNYNFKGTSPMFNSMGVMNSEGTKITVWGMSNKLEEWTWLDDDEVQEMKDDRDPFDKPRYNAIVHDLIQTFLCLP